MKMIDVLNRESTNITVAEFYERYRLEKYNFEPRYQRRGDVWDSDKQSFLIDTIIKNYPMPPIFLHQRIDAVSGSTKYDVIDGKQRLTAIVQFLENRIPLPQDFDDGPFGDKRLNGVFFKDLDGELAEFKKAFWRYIISVEYIDSEDLVIIDNVFDRLNRNGEPLEMQELRKAKYHDTLLMNTILDLVSCVDWTCLEKIRFNRMQDQEFVSELLFYILTNEPNDASETRHLDESYERWNVELTTDTAAQAKERFINAIQYLSNLQLDMDRYKIKGVSHYYALFAFCDFCARSGIPYRTISLPINEFYLTLRSDDESNEMVNAYRNSMQSNSKSKSQRRHRIEALSNYCINRG